ncbi:S9 family peptidase [Mesonia sediminis]|uniref:S9 family peptidase n=1 Tax=Mesonia sediminis TaxID=1703946 RepID=A0ABW5SHP8_9FLAO
MKKILIFLSLMISGNLVMSQEKMTPETLWSLKRLSVIGVDQAQNYIYYKLSIPNIENDNFDSEYYKIPLDGKNPIRISENRAELIGKKISPDGKYELFHQPVAIEKIKAKDKYEELPKANAYVYTDLDIRHWDTWSDGSFNHVFYKVKGYSDANGIDIMAEEPYHSPQKPFGGAEDYIWGPEGKYIYYVSKKLKGKSYAQSTNTAIYRYSIETKETVNITQDNKGYDTQPQFSKNGDLAYLQMKKDGYEADKNDLIVLSNGVKQNLTAQWDGTVASYKWANDGKRIYFTAPIGGTIQLFEVDFPGKKRKMPVVTQLTSGIFDIKSIILEKDNKLYVTRTDMNHAAEIFAFDLKKESFEQLTHINDEVYAQIAMPEIQKRYVTASDGKKMLVWVILPPNFDENKKYPALLYAQGGPQSPLSQFYSFRWNFQLMASQGYVVIAPNRRGMPGHGVKWNEDISKDWGGQVINDYISATDVLAKEPYIDEERIAAVGASFGGYSVFYLAGMHENKYKTFIAHDGVFDTRSMYGTTEELFFVNHDFGGAYWETENKDAQRAYHDFNPITHVKNWNTPIFIIQGGKDYRVPIEQGLSAYQAAQLLGVKSKLLYLPEENHWVLNPQNALVWQHEFFNWLKETL